MRAGCGKAICLLYWIYWWFLNSNVLHERNRWSGLGRSRSRTWFLITKLQTNLHQNEYKITGFRLRINDVRVKKRQDESGSASLSKNGTFHNFHQRRLEPCNTAFDFYHNFPLLYSILNMCGRINHFSDRNRADSGREAWSAPASSLKIDGNQSF